MPHSTVSGTYTNMAFINGLFLWTNYTNPTPTGNTPAPYPLIVNPVVNAGVVPGFAGDYRILQSSICSSFSSGTSRANATFSCGATLISPSYVVSANHCHPVKMWFQQPDMTEIVRYATSAVNINADLTLMKLNAPIYSIRPATIPSNPSIFGTHRLGFILENGGRYTHMRTEFTPTTGINELYLYCQVPNSNTGALIQPGNSAHPYIITVNTVPLCLGLVYQAGSVDLGNGYTKVTSYITNLVKYTGEMNAILAADGESVTTARIIIKP